MRPKPLAVVVVALSVGVLGVLVQRQTRPARPPRATPPRALNVVVVVDRELPAQRFELARDAARELLGALGPEDRLGFIGVGGNAITQSGSDEVPRGHERLQRWLDELERSEHGAEIGLGPPLQMAEQLLGLTDSPTRAARVLLISDGAHVQGVLSNPELRVLVTALDQRGVRVDALSPGTPQVRPPLEALAELGGGRLLVLHLAPDVLPLFDREQP